METLVKRLVIEGILKERLFEKRGAKVSRVTVDSRRSKSILKRRRKLVVRYTHRLRGEIELFPPTKKLVHDTLSPAITKTAKVGNKKPMTFSKH